MTFTYEITIGNVITFLTLFVGFVVSWQRGKDNVDALAGTVKEHTNQIASLLLSQTAGLILATKVEGYHDRLHKLEDIVASLVLIKIDVEWIKTTLRNQNKE